MILLRVIPIDGLVLLKINDSHILFTFTLHELFNSIKYYA